MSSEEAPKETTLAFISFGKIGSTILSALLNATSPETVGRSDDRLAKIARFVVSVDTITSAEKLQAQHEAKQRQNVVISASKPTARSGLYTQIEKAMDALEEKLVIDVMDGAIPRFISDPSPHRAREKQATFVKARANHAVVVRKSMTITDDHLFTPEQYDMVTWIFEQVGKVSYMRDYFDDTDSAVRVSMAMLTLPLEGILGACVARNLDRNEMMEMFAQVLEGLGGLLREGIHSGALRNSISDDSKPAARGMLQLEKSDTRAVFAEAMLTVGNALDEEQLLESARDAICNRTDD
ncbi:hypothetical protein BDW74DRAFT_179229 [Aspergillus multicolor]|uniref:pyrroline-5-carboxylate reductase family protein n=1 Tax=Aspergillus multicolor TaxID=41759 RepID=UPI003CCCFEE2